MNKITVIIPVYNAENCIQHTINSILNQSFKNFEILIINDGSTDSSLSIIESINDPRIRIITQKNSGAVSAYVNGIKNSKTEYIMFCDSDDFYKESFINDAYERIVSENVDIVNFKMNYVTPNMDVIKESIYSISCGKYNKSEIETSILPRITFNSFKTGKTHIIPVCRVTKICKRELLLKVVNEFDINIRQLEDNVFTTLILLNANSIYIDNRIEYDYVQQQISVSNGYKANLFNEYEKSVLYIKNLMQKYSFSIDEIQYTKLIIASTRVILRRIAKSSDYKLFKNDFNKIFKTKYIKELSFSEIDDKINLIFFMLLKLKCSLILYLILKKLF